MAKIIKTITGLKPDQDYLIALKVKNTEISAIDDPYESIRIHTPKDQTIPGAIDVSTFYIYGNYKSVMFEFQPTVELDVNGYKYELYSDALGATLISSGIATATVFSIDVPDNSNAANSDAAQTDVIYYGRVKTIDTSGNESGWTPSSGLKASTATDMIQGSHISSLTAAKITAGTIGAHEIILKQQGVQYSITAPANMAIIRSSNYNGSFNETTGIWTSGTSGWVISGDGRAEFSKAAIRGTLTAGSVFINTNNRWKSSEFGDTISDPLFKVGTSNNYMFYNGVDSLEVKGTIKAIAGKIAGWDIVGDNLQSGGGYNGSISIGPGNGPNSLETGGPTGELFIDAGIVPGYQAHAEYNAYFARWSRNYNGVLDYALAAAPDGITYQYSASDKFEFRLIGSTPYIVINGNQYPLTIGCPPCESGGGTPSGGGNTGTVPDDSGTPTPDPTPCACTNSATVTGICADVEVVCDLPGCWGGCRYYTYDYYTSACVESAGCTCSGVTCPSIVVTRGCSYPTVCIIP
jgi:hypothetical protein